MIRKKDSSFSNEWTDFSGGPVIVLEINVSWNLRNENIQNLIHCNKANQIVQPRVINGMKSRVPIPILNRQTVTRPKQYESYQWNSFFVKFN